MATTNTSAITNFSSFQVTGIDYLYDTWIPRQDNLFMLTEFKLDTWCMPSNTPSGTGAPDYAPTFKYRINKVSLSDNQSIGLNSDSFSTKMTQNFIINSTGKMSKVSIEWKDDVYRTMYKFHKAWLEKWYNRKYDCLRSGTEGKFYSAEFKMFQYDYSGNPTVVGTLELQHLMPVDIGNFGNLDYSNAGNESVYNVTYCCQRIQFTPTDDLCGNSGTEATGDYTTSNLENIIKTGTIYA